MEDEEKELRATRNSLSEKGADTQQEVVAAKT